MNSVKQDLIYFIITNNPKARKDVLELLSLEALVIIKVQLEIELSKIIN